MVLENKLVAMLDYQNQLVVSKSIIYSQLYFIVDYIQYFLLKKTPLFFWFLFFKL